jgi:hypothetical protein
LAAFVNGYCFGCGYFVCFAQDCFPAQTLKSLAAGLSIATDLIEESLYLLNSWMTLAVLVMELLNLEVLTNKMALLFQVNSEFVWNDWAL